MVVLDSSLVLRRSVSVCEAAIGCSMSCWHVQHCLNATFRKLVFVAILFSVQVYVTTFRGFLSSPSSNTLTKAPIDPMMPETIRNLAKWLPPRAYSSPLR